MTTPIFVTIAVVLAGFLCAYLIVTANQKRWDNHWRDKRVAGRADQQHAWVCAGNAMGIYGDYDTVKRMRMIFDENPVPAALKKWRSDSGLSASELERVVSWGGEVVKVVRR
jgi:hypothetical protein